LENQTDISKRVFAKIEHTQSRNDGMHRVSHPLEVRFTQKTRHGRAAYNSTFKDKKGMVAFLVTAAIVAVQFMIMVQKGCLTAFGA